VCNNNNNNSQLAMAIVVTGSCVSLMYLIPAHSIDLPFALNVCLLLFIYFVSIACVFSWESAVPNSSALLCLSVIHFSSMFLELI